MQKYNFINIEMKSFYLLLFTIVLLTSCYKEDRIKPTQSKLTTVTVPGSSSSNNSNSNSNSNNNSNTNISPVYLSNYNYIVSEKVDSNDNQRYSSLIYNISTTFSKAGKFKYSLYVKSYYGSYYGGISTYNLVGTSELISIPNNLNYNFSKKFYGDSLSQYLYTGYTSDYLNFYLVLQDSTGKYIQSNSYSTSTTISYNSIGSNNIESVKLDTIILNSVSNFSISAYTDNNLNSYPQSFNKVTLRISNSSTSASVDASKYYMKIYYKPLNSTSKILYGTISSLTTSTSSNYYSSNYEGSFTPLVDSLARGNYTFYVSLFDKTTNKEMNQPSQYSFTQLIESKKVDNRKFTFDYLGTSIKDDKDADGFPATYTFKILIKASDSAKVNLSSTLYYSNYGSNSYYFTLVSNQSIITGDTATFLVTGGTALSHSYYDLKLTAVETLYNFNIGSWDKSTVTKFGALPIEKFSED